MKAFALCFAVGLLGCSGSSADATVNGSASDGGGDGAIPGEASTPETAADAPSVDGHDTAPTEVFTDVAAEGPSDQPSDAPFDTADPLAAHPPAGATKCGEGTFAASDANTACMKPSFVLDDILSRDGGHGTTPRNCGAITTDGGAWQVWCSAGSTYVWARFDGVLNTNALHDCHDLSILWVDEAVYDTGSSGGNGAHVATYDAHGEVIGTVPGAKQTAIYELTLAGRAASTGAISLYVLGSLQDSCLGGAPQPPVVLSGIGVTWPSP